MKYAALVVTLAACSDGGGSAPDAGLDASGADAALGGLVISQVLPAGGQTVAIDEPAQYEVQLGNTGPQTGTITATLGGSTDFTVVTSDCVTLANSGSCKVELRLKPSVIGAIDAQLTFTATPGGTATANLHGMGLQKNTLQMTDRIDFHARAIGQTSAPIPVVVTNTGAVATGPLAVTIDAGKYSITADGCSGQAVPSQGTCTFSVVYAPTGTQPLGGGGDFSNFRVTGTPGGRTFATAAGYGATILFDEWQFLFPNTTIGATSAPKTLTVTNTQSFSIGPITSDLQFLTAAFVVQQDTCNGATLAAGATCTYRVAFTPTATGLVAGSIFAKAPDVGTLKASAGVTVGGTGQ